MYGGTYKVTCTQIDMNKLLIVLFFLMPSHPLWAETKIMKVNGMVCAFCAQGIEASLKGLSATEDVYINLDQHIVAVDLRGTDSVSNIKLKEIIVDAGYDVISIDMSDHPVEHIRMMYEPS